jgi:hypothetical protein
MPAQNTFRFEDNDNSVWLSDNVAQPTLAILLSISKGNLPQPPVPILSHDFGFPESAHSKIRAFIRGDAQSHCWIPLYLMALKATQACREVEKSVLVNVPNRSSPWLPAF